MWIREVATVLAMSSVSDCLMWRSARIWKYENLQTLEIWLFIVRLLSRVTVTYNFVKRGDEIKITLANRSNQMSGRTQVSDIPIKPYLWPAQLIVTRDSSGNELLWLVNEAGARLYGKDECMSNYDCYQLAYSHVTVRCALNDSTQLTITRPPSNTTIPQGIRLYTTPLSISLYASLCVRYGQ